MFSRVLNKHHIILKKGQNIHILWRLLWNRVLLLKLRFSKWIRGIHHPIVHYYAVCWNEEKMLPFMFDYYEDFVDHFTIYDNYSDDRSEEIIRSRKDTNVVKFSMDGKIDDKIYQRIKNNCWKRSRGKADFVIVCDIDEFVYHPDMSSALAALQHGHVSLPLTEGYNMYSTVFPTFGDSIVSQVRLGVKDAAYNKSLLFDPHRIVEINYLPGAHVAKPVGMVKSSDQALRVLHYKNIDLDYVLHRSHLLAARLSEGNKEEGLGTHYLYSDEEIASSFYSKLSECQVVVNE